jgi:hypothetical protein
MATGTIKVAAYRDLIDRLGQAFDSLKSAASPAERCREAEWVRRAAQNLMAVECRRARQYDRNRAERLIDLTAACLAEGARPDHYDAPQDLCPRCKGGSYAASPHGEDYLVSCKNCNYHWLEPII